MRMPELLRGVNRCGIGTARQALDADDPRLSGLGYLPLQLKSLSASRFGRLASWFQEASTLGNPAFVPETGRPCPNRPTE